MSPKGLAAAAAIAVAVTAGCALGPTRGHLLSEGGATICVPGDATRDTQIGWAVLDNTDSQDPAEVTSVSLTGATDVTLVSAWVLPLETWQDVVTGAPFDAVAAAFPATDRVDGPGTPVVPAGESRGLVVVVRGAEPGGSVEGARVQYDAGSREYYAEGGPRLVISAHGTVCAG